MGSIIQMGMKAGPVGLWLDSAGLRQSFYFCSGNLLGTMNIADGKDSGKAEFRKRSVL